MEKGIAQGLISISMLKTVYKYIIFIFLGEIFFCSENLQAQNCPSLNVIGSFYDLPSNSPPNYATAQANGLCYELRPPYPSQVCFEYMVPFSDTVRATFHLKACGSQSSIGTGTYSAGCSGTASTNATFIGQSTYDNSCSLIANYIAVGYCGGAVSGDIMTVCFDLNVSTACDPITICPMLFCNTGICATGLPVELLNFDVNCEKDISTLRWTTSSEINNDYFIIEKSNDGEQFHQIGIVKGFGNSSVIRDYSFEDDDVISGADYYRLKQVDFNGEYYYSNTIVRKCSSNNFNIYPNPANSILNINWEKSSNQVVDVIITNSIGQVVFEKTTNKALTSVNIESLNKGFYQLQIVEDNNNRSISKFVKQ